MTEHESYQGQRVLVLGAAGFIGRWVARYLSAAGAALLLPVRDPAAARTIFARHAVAGQIVPLDLRQPAALTRLLHDARPALVFNLAGYGVDRGERDEATAHAINTALLETLGTAMAAAGAPGWGGQRIVHVGSALEYGEIGGDLNEASVPNATTLYGRTKLAGTRALAAAARAHGLRAVTARLFTIYGPGEHPGRLLPALLETARTRQPLPLTAGAQLRDFTYVEDVADGLLRLGVLETAVADSVVNLATGRLTAVRRFVEIAADTLRIPPHLLQFGALPTRREEMAHDDVAIGRLRQHLNWRPATDIAAGVARTQAFDAQNPLPAI
ncbi:MAG: NAD-dependent epimerase/dehydratase [Anaerolineales bacterium]|nr:NAD-dependent epimerase/dehydratase [Anaerolineales bacterium]